MKRKIIVLITSVLALGASAQIVNGDERLQNIDWTEDSTEITTINDIINEQQDVSTRNSNVSHFEDVWSRRGYFNISFSNTTLDPVDKIPTGLNGGVVPKYKSSWGAAIQLGRSYRLHKKPIANTLQFYIDYTYIDLGVNHFKAESAICYDSSKKYDVVDGTKTNSYYYIPWNLEKYEANYSMTLGPSMTIAPFNYVNSLGLHYLRLNFYYHIGYGVSFLYMLNDTDADANPDKYGTDYKNMSDNMKLCWGHGLTNSFGLSLTWKFIGLGYEHQSRNIRYKSMNTKEFENETYKFDSSVNRFFIQFRM
jgi:hypothetical protein